MTRPLHSEFSPSSADRWLNCPGSIALVRAAPRVETDYMREGTLAHRVAELLLKGTSVWQVEYLLSPSEGMLEAVQEYVEIVRRYHARGRARGRDLYVEQPVDILTVDGVEVYGTADAIVRDGKRVAVLDLKYGQGYVVPADAIQLGLYALGAGGGRAARTVVVQPRTPDPIRPYDWSREDLGRVRAQAIEAVRAAQQPGAALNPGPWCRFCPAAGSCPALAEQALAVARQEFTAIDQPPDPAALPLETVGEMLTALPVLEHWALALRARAHDALERGEEIPGWKLVPKRATRYWKSETDVVSWAEGRGIASEVYAEPKLRSPAQVEKLVGKRNLPAYLYESRSSGTTLAPEGDPRPAVNPGADFVALPPGDGGEFSGGEGE